MGAAIALDRHVAQNANRGPVDQVRAFLSIALAAELVVVGPANRFGHADIADAVGDFLGAEAHIANDAGGAVFGQVHELGKHWRAGPGPQRHRHEAGDGRVAVDEFLVAENINHVEGVTLGVRFLVRVGVRGQEALLGKRPGRRIEPAAVLRAALDREHTVHAAFGRLHVGRDDGHAFGLVDAEGGVHDHERPGRQRVVAGSDADELLAAGDGADVFEGPGIDEVLLKDGIRASAIGPDAPDGLDEGPTALVILPAEIADRAIIQSMGEVIAILVRAQAADTGAVGLHDVKVAARFILVVFVALERGAASLGDEDNVAAGGVGRVQVTPLAGGELAQVPPIDADLEEMRGLHGAAEVIALRAVEPACWRLVARRTRIPEHDTAAIPP